ncbi:MAG: P1 family peptidase [Chloroflexota bacterium]|nr:P1 family peptidase [Chloroflexota bacterium]
MNSLTDVPGLRVGHWTDAGGRTGCTVVLAPPDGAVAAIDVRGGAAGTFNTELLRPANLVERVHALVLTGGSAFGLASCSGVIRYLKEQGTGLQYGDALIPIVCGGVIFDLGVASGPPPDAQAGYAACQAADAHPKRGSIGAGAGATVGKALRLGGAMRGGLGMASGRAGDHVVAVLAVVNAFGDVVDRQGRIVAGARQADGRFLDAIGAMAQSGHLRPAEGNNTTLAVVATTAQLTKEQAMKVAQMAHDGFGRAIRPAHTMVDGDLVFALSVASDAPAPADVSVLGAIAAEAVVEAILDAVRSASGDAAIPAVADRG